MWQDILLMIGGFGFSLALLPSVFGKNKPSSWTSGVTGTILVFFALAYGTLGLWLACVATSMTAALWFVLLFQAERKEL